MLTSLVWSGSAKGVVDLGYFYGLSRTHAPVELATYGCTAAATMEIDLPVIPIDGRRRIWRWRGLLFFPLVQLAHCFFANEGEGSILVR